MKIIKKRQDMKSSTCSITSHVFQ